MGRQRLGTHLPHSAWTHYSSEVLTAVILSWGSVSWGCSVGHPIMPHHAVGHDASHGDTPFLHSRVVSKRGRLSLLYLKPGNGVLLRSGTKQPLPTLPASSSTIQPTGHTEHLSSILHMLFPLLPSTFPQPSLLVQFLLILMSQLYGHFLRGPFLTVHVPLLHVLLAAHNCPSENFTIA